VLDGLAVVLPENRLDRLAALPGVKSVGLVNSLPLDQGAGKATFATEYTNVAATGTVESPMRVTFADGGYFPTMGIRLVSGSLFERNTKTSNPVGVIVSENAGKQLWPGENPLGKRLRRVGSSDKGWLIVTGVVEDVMLDDLRQAATPMIYLPLVGESPRSWVVALPAYVVKTSRAEMIAPDVRTLIREFAPGAPMFRVFTMRGLAARSMARLSFSMLTVTIAASLALILGAVGIYGTLSYVVAQRTREIGIRIALGAEAREVRRMVVAHGGLVAGIGVVLGVVSALFLTRLLDTLLFGVAAIDMATFIAMPVVMIGIALMASYVPAWRASSVDPTVSLRME